MGGDQITSVSQSALSDKQSSQTSTPKRPLTDGDTGKTTAVVVDVTDLTQSVEVISNDDAVVGGNTNGGQSQDRYSLPFNSYSPVKKNDLRSTSLQEPQYVIPFNRLSDV